MVLQYFDGKMIGGGFDEDGIAGGGAEGGNFVKCVRVARGVNDLVGGNSEHLMLLNAGTQIIEQRSRARFGAIIEHLPAKFGQSDVAGAAHFGYREKIGVGLTP